MLAALFLIIAATLFRVLPPLLHIHHDWMSNFSPLASLVVCGAVFFTKRMAILVPFVILLISDCVLNYFVYHFTLVSWEIIPRYLVFLVIGALTFRYRHLLRVKPFALLGTTFASSLLFFIATNSASWMGDARYVKNAAGWLQALTIGLPGYPPTILFFRNSVISDLLFTALFMVCMSLTAKREIAVTTKTVVAY